MEVKGNIARLKEKVKETFREKAAALEKEKENELTQLRKELGERKEKYEQHARERTEQATQQEIIRLLSSRRLEERRTTEELKYSFLNELWSDLEKQVSLTDIPEYQKELEKVLKTEKITEVVGPTRPKTLKKGVKFEKSSAEGYIIKTRTSTIDLTKRSMLERFRPGIMATFLKELEKPSSMEGTA